MLKKIIKIKNITFYLISSLNSKENTICDKCYGAIDKENFQHVIDKSQNVIEISNKEVLDLKTQYEEKVKSLNENTEKFQKTD